MSWESLTSLQKRFRRKLDFRDVYFPTGIPMLAGAAIFAMSENYRFNLIILERNKIDETRNLLTELTDLDVIGPDVLLYHDRPSPLDNVMKISSKQEIRRTELDFMAFAQRRPFIVVSFNPPSSIIQDDANAIHLIRLLCLSNNFRGLILSQDNVGEEFAVYA
jgi:hypothetical protein